jgi:hypothetical protein
MSILATFTKQPADVQDYDIDYSEWLAGFSDTGSSATVTVDTGITLNMYTLLNGVVKVWLAGGTSGETYKVTTTLTTSGGRTKQAEIRIKVKET